MQSPNAQSLMPDALFKVRGQLRPNADISKNTWFQVGGAAELLFKPADAEDLADFMKQKPAGLPVTVIGVGSNLLVRDGGVKGVVIRLGRGFTEASIVRRATCDVISEDSTQHAARSTCHFGAACLDVHAAQFAAEQGIGGLEFLSGVPGTIGGAVFMNAGAYGSDISAVLVSVSVVTKEGEIKTFSNAECGFTYRHSALPEGCVVVSAVLRGVTSDKGQVMSKIKEIQEQREATQPIRSKTGGSTFKNPEGHKAWELIDKAGCRGLMVGGAQVSEKHCNFLINTGNATAADIENLGEEVRERVKEKTGIALEWEIKRIGETL